MNYKQFIESKKHSSINYGIDVKFEIDKMFPYQKKVLEWAVNKGRGAVFLDTGLGKTLIELAVAQNYVQHTNKPVLIITPLAVAFQFIKEAEKFGLGDIEYSKDGNYKSKIVVCNYERLDKFDCNDFDCVILDESSILKNYKGAIKTAVTAFMRKVKYRYLFTATPSPNDFHELGTSSEALGYLGYMEMLGMFFSNNENNISPLDIGSKWYLKPHAEMDFFKWVSSWSISMRKPSDLGFSDDNHTLPELIVNNHSVKNNKNWIVNGQIMMFNRNAKRLSEVNEEQKQTITERCEKAVEVSKGKKHTVYWVNFNKEGDLINELDKDSFQLTGSMKLDQKEEMLLAFANGEIKRLVTKSKMTAFGLNWQHCNHTVYFPTFSYERYYQSIRRFWRFGQKKPVIVDMVYSDGQVRVIKNLMEKAERADRLFEKLNLTLNSGFKLTETQFNNPISIPNFIK